MYDVMKIVNWLRVRNNSDLRTDDNAEELTQLKAMKLLYYIQGASLIYLKSRLFSQDIVAWKYGPAVVEVHNKYSGKRGIVGNITDKDINDYKELNKDEKCADILNVVYDTFGNISAYDLMKMTHTESPWRNTKQGSTITDDEMIKYFKTIVEI